MLFLNDRHVTFRLLKSHPYMHCALTSQVTSSEKWGLRPHQGWSEAKTTPSPLSNTQAIWTQTELSSFCLGSLFWCTFKTDFALFKVKSMRKHSCMFFPLETCSALFLLRLRDLVFSRSKRFVMWQPPKITKNPRAPLGCSASRWQMGTPTARALSSSTCPKSGTVLLRPRLPLPLVVFSALVYWSAALMVTDPGPYYRIRFLLPHLSVKVT